MAPMMGMMTSPTSELTIAPKAAPIKTPTARSTTLPFIANSLNSFSTANPLLRRRAYSEGAIAAATSLENALVDQAGVHHGAAHGDARSFLHRHHWQTQPLVHLAEQRHRIFD